MPCFTFHRESSEVRNPCVARQARRSSVRSLLLTSLLVASLSAACATGSDADRAEAGDRRPIYSLERISLGGMDNAILLRGRDSGNPLLLWLHGGPGAGQIDVAWKRFSALEEDFVLVQWDQPGAGKSNPRCIDETSLTFARFISDARELTAYLKARFPGRPIFLLGHSWGSQLGARLARDYPEDYAAYIGVSQVVKAEAAEMIAYEWLGGKIAGARCRRDAKTLESLGPPPYADHEAYVGFARLVESYGGGMDIGATELISTFLQSPDYRLGDLSAWLRGAKRGSGVMWEETRRQDLRKDVPSLGLPSYFISGVLDRNTPPELVELYVEALDAPRKRFVRFEHSAHTPFFAEPGSFAQELGRIKEEILGAE